jgi:RecA/RadA recombinase
MAKKKTSKAKGKSDSSPKTVVASTRKKKKEDEAPEKVHGKADEAWFHEMQKSRKWAGRVCITEASADNTSYLLRRPTGIMGLDIALGGGLHAGGLIELHGGQSIGKTHLAYRTAGQIQRIYGEDARIGIAITEVKLDKAFARTCGCCVGYSPEEIGEFNDLRNDDGLPPFTPEEVEDLQKQIGKIYLIRGGTGDEVLQNTLTYLEKLGNDSQLIIMESLGALLTPDQDEKEVGDRVYGGSAGIVTTFIAKLNPLLVMPRADGSQTETTILAINQHRARIDGGPRGPQTKPASGAWALKHAQMASIGLRRGETLWADGSHTRQSGKEVKWELTKGKAGCHDGLKGAFNYYHVPRNQPVFWKDYLAYGSTWGIDTITELAETARAVGAIEVSGAWMRWNVDGEEVKGQGAANFAQLLVDNPELVPKLQKACLRAAGVVVRYR